MRLGLMRVMLPGGRTSWRRGISWITAQELDASSLNTRGLSGGSFRVSLVPILDRLFAIVAGIRVDQAADSSSLLGCFNLESSKHFSVLDEDDCWLLSEIVTVRLEGFKVPLAPVA